MALSPDAAAARESTLIAEMTDILRRKMERDHAAGATRRDAHPKTLGVLAGSFTVEDGLPAALRVGVFSEPRRFECWVRLSNASAKLQPDTVPDLRGLAIKLLYTSGRDGRAAPLGQDFVLLSHPTMPLGTVELFRDLVYYSAERSLLQLLVKFIATGRLGVLRQLRSARISPSSPLDIPYWSTTPYRFGAKREVKYSVLPTSGYRSPSLGLRAADYLSAAMAAHLDTQEASFDFCVQLRQADMPLEDAAVRWDEAVSPFLKVATLQIPRQQFRTPEREALGEALSYSPGNAWPEHAPLGGINRARVVIYQQLAAFRLARDKRAGVV